MTHRFKVGDEVRFRSWQDMLDEFGPVYDTFISSIGTPGACVNLEMRKLCGCVATVTYCYFSTFSGFSSYSEIPMYSLRFHDADAQKAYYKGGDETFADPWVISDFMLEPVHTKHEFDFDSDGFEQMIGGVYGP